MNCQNCGANVDGKAFCSWCGKPVSRQPVYQQAPPAVQPQGRPTDVLVFGILGLALGATTGIVGLIFSIIGLSKASNYINTYGDISTQARIGKRLSLAGLFVSIFMIILYIAMIVLIVVAVNMASKEPDGTRRVLEQLSRSLK